MSTKKHSALFRAIEELQAGRPWGRVLDAGTGYNSIRWLLDQETDQWTAVTGAPDYAERIKKMVGRDQRPDDQLILGNWADPELLKGEVYDTVLADYLLGAIEGFAPYFQPFLFPRLRPLVGSTLYITGLEPYVPAAQPQDKAARLVWQIGRHRDACFLLAGDRPYREYPSAWVADHLQHAGFTVTHLKRYAIRYRDSFVNTQIDMAISALNRLPDRKLADALKERGETIRAEALETIQTDGALRAGHDYVIAAEPV